MGETLKVTDNNSEAENALNTIEGVGADVTVEEGSNDDDTNAEVSKVRSEPERALLVLIGEDTRKDFGVTKSISKAMELLEPVGFDFVDTRC